MWFYTILITDKSKISIKDEDIVFWLRKLAYQEHFVQYIECYMTVLISYVGERVEYVNCLQTHWLFRINYLSEWQTAVAKIC